MSRNPRRTRVIVVSVLLVLAMATGAGVWLARQGGEEPPAASGTAPTVAPGTTTPQPQRNVRTVKVYFHDRLQTDPRQVVAVSRTVPRSPRVATATLAELLRGPSAREQEAGYWSFFSAGTAGKLRSLRIAAGLATADFADFRRAMPNATTSYGSAALLAELDATLKQFPTVRRTLYAFNGDVAAFYEWLQLAPPTTGRWRPIAAAPISGRDGAAAVWTGRQLLVWGGHRRVPGQGLGPMRDGASYDPAADRWQRIPDAPAGVQGTATGTAWTGTSLLVWMGNAPDGPAVGAAYDPAARSWRRMAASPLGPRESFSTMWTGRELIVFGGSSGDALASPVGAAYDPASDRWRVLPRAPIADRLGHAAVWAGGEMLVWGGRGAGRAYGDGAAYDPASDRWRPIARHSPSAVAAAVWTGTRMLVWSTAKDRTGGAQYDPVRDRWTPIARGPVLGGLLSGPVWTGSQMVAWDGGAHNRGVAYAPGSDAWSLLPRAPLATDRGLGRFGAAMVWTGRDVLVWGGWNGAAASPPFRDGAAYRPAARL
jgi:N-acetylneuraminic acid mutarotase